MEGRKSLQTVPCSICQESIKILTRPNESGPGLVCVPCQQKKEQNARALSNEESIKLGEKMLSDPERYMDHVMKVRGVPNKYLSKTLASFKGTYPNLMPGMIWGKTGVGKTHLAIGYMKRWIAVNLQPFDGNLTGNVEQVNEHFYGVARKALFISSLDIVWEMRASASTQETKQRMDLYCGYDLLIIDDFGAERQTEWAIEVLNKIVHSRHANGRQTLLTTNVSLKQIAEIFGDRTASRIQEFGDRIEVDGKDGRSST